MINWFPFPFLLYIYIYILQPRTRWHASNQHISVGHGRRASNQLQYKLWISFCLIFRVWKWIWNVIGYWWYPSLSNFEGILRQTAPWNDGRYEYSLSLVGGEVRKVLIVVVVPHNACLRLLWYVGLMKL